MTDYKIIACSTIRDEVEALRGDIPVDYLEGFLHDTPDVLREKIQERIDATPGDCTILLAYGRCSNGTADLEGRRAPPRAAGLRRLHLASCSARAARTCASSPSTPGTYYYTRGWIEELEDPYREYLKVIPRMGEEKARMVAMMIMESYTRIAVIDTGTYDLEKANEYVDTVSEFYDLPVEQLDGSLRLLEKLIRGPHDDEFIVVEPGEHAQRGHLLGDERVRAGAGDAAEPGRLRLRLRVRLRA